MIAIALMEPEIPQNTGNIIRLSVALGVELFLVGPLGYSLDDRRVRRARMDYLRDARLREFANRHAFEEATTGRRLVGVDPRGRVSFRKFEYEDDDILVFGSESSGLSHVPDASVFIPMVKGCRSINLANAVAIVAYEALKNAPHLVRPVSPGSPVAPPAWGGEMGAVDRVRGER